MSPGQEAQPSIIPIAIVIVANFEIKCMCGGEGAIKPMHCEMKTEQGLWLDCLLARELLEIVYNNRLVN